jgi:hypothetical protein
MEAMLGVSLYSCLYLKLAKMICLSYYLLFSLQQNQRTKGRTGSAQKRGWGCGEWEEEERAQTMYTHVSKCKKKIK